MKPQFAQYSNCLFRTDTDVYTRSSGLNLAPGQCYNEAHRQGRRDDDVKISNAHQAVVDLAKLESYALNPQHPDGRHKARVFAAALGLSLEDAPMLRATLLDIVQSHEAVERTPIRYGRRFTIDFEMKTEAGQATVRSAWIVRQDETFPRLTSCYVLLK
jgi:hypothetical protein